MMKTASQRIPLPGVWTKLRELLIGHHIMIYMSALLLVCALAYGYGLRTRMIFACQADGYSDDRYLAYCNASNYADYEHGAFKFNLESHVRDAITRADVLFLGNSRLQVAYSTAPTEHWFSSNSARYYLMGFGNFGNSLFAGELLRSVQPRANVYIIDVDDFFKKSETAEVKTVLHDPNARNEYEAKRVWQGIHERICGTFTALCGRQFAIYRSRDTGTYYEEGQWGRTVPVSYDWRANSELAGTSIATAAEFLSRFAQNKCVVLTMVPTVRTQMGTAKAIANGLDLPLIAPVLVDGLQTYDGSHLDQASAQRWAHAFFQAAGPEIRSCLDKREAANGQRQ
jgi:hypothetical protein